MIARREGSRPWGMNIARHCRYQPARLATPNGFSSPHRRMFPHARCPSGHRAPEGIFSRFTGHAHARCLPPAQPLPPATHASQQMPGVVMSRSSVATGGECRATEGMPSTPPNRPGLPRRLLGTARGSRGNVGLAFPRSAEAPRHEGRRQRVRLSPALRGAPGFYRARRLFSAGPAAFSRDAFRVFAAWKVTVVAASPRRHISPRRCRLIARSGRR